MDCQRDTEARSPLQTQLFSLQGHTALVTGAGSGLGKYMAHALLHAGANLILVGRTLDRLEASADEIFLRAAISRTIPILRHALPIGTRTKTNASPALPSM